MESFLKFVACELLDGPASGSSFYCPFCAHKRENQEWASLSVFPPDGQHRIRWQCHFCRKRGDEFDLVRWHLGLSFDAAKLYLEKLLDRYVRDYGTTSPLGERGGANPVLTDPRQKRQATALTRSLNRKPSISPNGEATSKRPAPKPKRGT